MTTGKAAASFTLSPTDGTGNVHPSSGTSISALAAPLCWVVLVPATSSRSWKTPLPGVVAEISANVFHSCSFQCQGQKPDSQMLIDHGT